MTKLTVGALGFVCLGAALAFAQKQNPGDQPSKYIWYEVVRINNGKDQAFAKMVSDIHATVDAVAPELYWITASPVTGESNRMMIVTFHNSMASIENMETDFAKVEKAVSLENPNLAAQVSEVEAGSRWVLAQYTKDLSYHPDAVPMSETTWWRTELLSLKPGCEYEFDESVKQAAELHKKADDGEHWMTYEIRAGYKQPSMLFVKSLRSLGDEDKERPAAAAEVFENPLVRQMFEKVGKECIEDIEATYFRVVPSLSRPPQALAAANPAFWSVRREH
jgi:hypothetical protein